MKKLLNFLFTLVLFNQALAQDFFDTDQVRIIEITFTQNNWDDILDTYYTAGDEFRLIGSLTLDSVGVRYKGNSSYNANNVKNPLNIKLDYIKGKQNIDGRNTLKLSNVFRDPSFVREVISYEIARNYLPASASNYAKVYINGTYIGLYVNDEAVNDAFTESHFFKSTGGLFDGEFTPGATPVGCAGGSPKILGYLGTNQDCYEQFYVLQKANLLDWNDLIAALDTFNNYPNAIDNAIYIDRLLWFLAVNNVLVNLDSPISPPHNFSLYKDGTNRFNIIPWDLNQSFGSFTNIAGISLITSQLQQLSPWVNATSINYPILTKAFASEQNKKMYIAKMRTILKENFENNYFSDRINSLQTLINSAVQQDVNKFYTNTEFTQNTSSTVQNIIGLNELMTQRLSYLSTQVDIVKVAPIISNVSHTPEIVAINSSVVISANISNATSAFLGYRFSPKDKFTKINMTNNAGTYSATINVTTADVQYYIWAENADAGVFSPERAEYEFYTIGVTGNLVINEIQASNVTTTYDEAGDYDDWIELYNKSDQAIDLTGYYLSDNKDTLTKWAIPSQSIQPNEYLIFWADKTPAQGTNHTNFLLKITGESLYLVDNTGAIINQVTYPKQNTDKAFARFPNGTGAFIEKEPTFKANNGDTALAIHKQSNELDEIALYPNPTNGEFYLQAKTANHFQQVKDKAIVVYDFSGRKVYESIWGNEKTQKININLLSKGIYLLQIYGEKSIKFELR